MIRSAASLLAFGRRPIYSPSMRFGPWASYRRYVLASAAIVLCATGCGPRGAMTAIFDPEAHRTTSIDDIEVAFLTDARRQADANPVPDTVVTFANRLIKAVQSGLPQRRQRLGEPLDVTALASDSVRVLEVAAQRVPDEAARMYVIEAMVWKTIERPQQARAAAEKSFQVVPNFPAFRWLTKEAPRGQELQGNARDALCVAIRPRIRFASDVSRDQQAEVIFEIVDFLDQCKGVCNWIVDGESTRFEFCDWVSDKEAESYRLVRRAEREASQDEQRRQEERSKRDTQKFFREACYRRCDESYAGCSDAATSCMASRRACGASCDQER